MFRRLRAYRAPLAILLAFTMLTVLFSIQLVGDGSIRSLGYSVTVQVQGLTAGAETSVAIKRGNSIQYQTTRGHVAVFENVAAGNYALYTDPNDSSRMAISNIHVPTQLTATVRMQPYYSVMVAATGADAAKAYNVELHYNNGDDFFMIGTSLKSGYATIKAPVGTHLVKITDRNRNVLATKTVTVTDDDVLAEFVLGSAVTSRNDLTVRVSGGGAAHIYLYDSGSSIIHSAWVQNGVAQFLGLEKGRYLVEVNGDGTGDSGFAVANIPSNREVTVKLSQPRTVNLEVTGSRSGRAVYVNYSYENRQMLYSSAVSLSGGRDSVQLPAGSYTAYLYDVNRRLLTSKSFRVSGAAVNVRVTLDSSSSSSGSGTSRWTTTKWPVTSGSGDTPGALSRSKAESLTKTAAASARREGADSVVVRVKDIGSATRSALRSMGENAGNLPVRLHADSMSESGGRVEVRIILDPDQVDRDLNLYGSTTNSQAERVRRKFRGWYANRICVVHLNQREAWGQEVQVVALVDLVKFDIDNLHIYRYNTAANSYKLLENTNYWVDSKGYLHFNTEYAGDLIISNGALRK